MPIEIPYSPRVWAQELHNSKKRWNVIVAHRRSGKTTATLNHLQRSAAMIPESRYAYIAPYYKQAKSIAWDMMKYYSRVIPGIKFNEAELTVTYPNSSKITLYGADNVDALRGIGLWGVAFDEYSQQPANIFSEVISKTLADHRGYAIWIGTPKGKNEFYKIYQNAKHSEEWLAIFKTIEDTLKTEKGETVENLRKSLEDDRKMVKDGVMSKEEFEQEWYCSFTAAIRGAYYAEQLGKMRAENRITAVPHVMGLGVYTFWDLGVSDATCIGFFQKVGQEWHMIDCYEASGEGLAHYAKVLQDKGYIYTAHYAPHDIKVQELGSGQSRLELARGLGINFQLAPNLHVEDGINAVRMKLNQLWIDEKKCARFLDALSLYRKEWNEKTGTFKLKPLHDWTSDYCFTKDTKVLTDKGEKNIIDIQVGDKLITPLGLSDVLVAKNMGKKKVYNFIGTKVTANHPFLTNRGFVPLDMLRYDDILMVWKKNVSSMIKLGFVVIPIPLLERIKFIFNLLNRAKQVERKLVYTDIFGLHTTAKYQMGFLSITKMVTPLITILKILNLLLPRNTVSYMTLEVGESTQLKSQENMPLNGTNLKKGKNGTLKWLKMFGREKNQQQKDVKCVGKSTRHIFPQGQSSAEIIAEAQCCGEEEVYNLSTSKGVYLANGVLVRNCDMIRYWAVTQIDEGGAQYRPKWSGHYGKRSKSMV